MWCLLRHQLLVKDVSQASKPPCPPSSSSVGGHFTVTVVKGGAGSQPATQQIFLNSSYVQGPPSGTETAEETPTWALPSGGTCRAWIK